jgi:hypothetical protein
MFATTSVMQMLVPIAARSVNVRRSLASLLALLAVGATGLLLPMKAAAAFPVTTNPIQLDSNWSGNAGYGSSVPAWYEAQGLIHLQGAAKLLPQQQIPGYYVLGTLPPEARPDRTVYTVVHTFAGTYSALAIYTNGQIAVFGDNPPPGPDYTVVSLEGVTYRPYQGMACTYPATSCGQLITLNAANWQSD